MLVDDLEKKIVQAKQILFQSNKHFKVLIVRKVSGFILREQYLIGTERQKGTMSLDPLPSFAA